MSRRFALGALVAVAAVTILGVWPALAAFPPTAAINKPTEGVTWTGGDGADFHVMGTATTDSGNVITKVTAKADPPPGDKGTHHYTQTETWTDQSASRSFDIQIFPDVNGKYRVTVFASGYSCNFLGICQNGDTDGPASAPRNITLAVPPRTPEEPRATLSSGKVTFQWKSNNTEKDLMGYIVERDVDGGDYKCLTQVGVDPNAAKPPTFSIADDLTAQPSGDYQWRVKAIRASDADSQMSTCAKDGTGIASVPSQRALIRWANPTQPTTTTTTPGGTTTTTKPKSGGGAGAGNSTGAAKPSPRPNLSALGTFGVTNNLATPPHLPSEADPGFNELLPFKAPTDLPADSGTAQSAQTPLPTGGNDSGSTNTLLFLAAGLLVTVLSMHVLWLKAQVDRMPLEPLTPVDTPLA